MKFELKENTEVFNLNNWKDIDENLWVSVTPCYHSTENNQESEYYCHLFYIAKGDKRTAPRKAFYMRSGSILRPVKYEELDEKGYFGGDIVGTYTVEGNTYAINIDIDRIKDMW